jgi:hypothetical protein
MRPLRMVRRDEETRQERRFLKVEDKMAKIPSDAFLWAAGLSILGSLAMKMARRDEDAHFVGQWAPTLLILGLYNKMVKHLSRD